MASENLGRIYYEVDIETGKLVSSSNTAEASIDRLDKKLDESEKTAQRTSTGMTKLAKAIGAVIAASAIRDMARMVQSYQEMAERVQMASSSQEEFERVQRRLLATANGTYRNLAEAQELYIRTADSLRSMGYTTEQALDVTDSMSYAFVKNATSADRANAAITAFSKSMNTGKVAADQWETISTALPTVINDIAAASGKSAAQVRALGAAGKLTAQDLSEGLRKALDANAEAAANMANNLVDAGVRSRNALTQVLVSLEEQTGALDAFTNGIITAADLVTEFAGDADKMAMALATLEVAATSMAAIMAGRMVMSLAAGAQGFYAATVAATAKARADVAAAQAAATLAAQELLAARAAEQAAVGLSTHAAAAARLTAAQTAATAATTALGNAQRVMAGTATLATRAVGLLRGAYALIGGPAGVALLAATAVYTFFTRAREAKAPTDDLTKSVRELTSAQRELAALETTRKLEELAEKAYQLGENLKYAQEQTGGAGRRSQRYAEDALRMRVEQEKLNEEIATYRKRLDDLNNYKGPTVAASSAEPTLTAPADPAAEKAAQRAVDAIKERVAALELEADTLGMTETELELYKLQLAGATDEQIRAAATSRGLIDAWEMQTAALEEQKRAREAFGKDPAATIRGNVDPLSGGMFDQQTARYEAERVAEEERYAAQLERLRQAKAAEVEVIGGYQRLEEQMAQEHAGRMQQIEQAKNQMLLQSGSDIFGSLADISRQFAGEQSGIYKAMFAASKAFAIAQSIISIQQGIAMAAANPWPANIGAMASVAAATAGLVSNIASVTMGGGRQYGGPVQQGSAYRINENGAPEILNSANGRQYLLPNTRGQVVSNRDAAGGGGGVTNYVTISIDSAGTAATSSSGSDPRDAEMMANGIRAVVIDELYRQNQQGGALWEMRNNA